MEEMLQVPMMRNHNQQNYQPAQEDPRRGPPRGNGGGAMAHPQRRRHQELNPLAGDEAQYL